MTPLTVAEARAIVIADDALDLSYEARLATGNTFGNEEREAWQKLVESAKDRITAFEHPRDDRIPRVGDLVEVVRDGFKIIGRVEHVPTGTEVWFRVRSCSPARDTFEVKLREMKVIQP